MRSTITGHLYERNVIYRTIAQTGRDPMSNVLATNADYMAAPDAARAARRYAQMLGATALPV